ncbi:MAG: exodeoxyribonuclease VII large subunit [Firmicutes bacterium]|nr:exodeoxyribonuclease VII large subunit [Bacillota bacterium]
MRILSVANLTKYIKDRLENDYLLTNLWVKGEISNLKRHSSGHVYFTLKDDRSSVRAVMFRSKAYRLPFEPRNGMAVTIRGYISVYAPIGSYQLYVEEMEPDGIGSLYLAFEQLKKKLQQEGLFHPDNKKQLPKYPSCIAIVTSPTGAAVKDMIKVITGRWPLARLVLVPVLVQGEFAPDDICRGIKQVNQWGQADVMIVGRGGGSLEELWAFNSEIVARTVAESKTPIISAVGHETDVTIIDYAADVRAATPSNAAEMVVPDQQEMRRHLQILLNRCSRAVTQQVKQHRVTLMRLQQSKALKTPQRAIIDARVQHVDMLQREMVKNIRMILTEKRSSMRELASSLNSLSPLATLARGYSLCSDQNGELIKRASDVTVGGYVQVKLHHGELLCTVNDKNEKDTRKG